MENNSKGKYQTSITGLPDLGRNRYENIFKLYLNEADQFYYNLNKSVSFPAEIDEKFLSYFSLDREVPWTIISYNIYGTIFLWWTITELNRISNPVILPPTGTVIKYIKPGYIDEILSQIQIQKNA
jgi:hypothetical protein